MRLLYVFAICLFASVNLFAAELLPLDKDGFGGIKWGTEFSSADKLGMKECIDYGTHIICTKNDESLKDIGGMPIEVAYIFEGSYFNFAIIMFDDACQWPVVIDLLTKAYGKSEHESYYQKKIGRANILGTYRQYPQQWLFVAGDIDVKKAVDERLNNMALSLFTEEERKNLDGFLGVKWGIQVKQIPHKLTLVKSVGSEKIYLQNENLYFGSIPVDSIEYIFVNDKLDSIMIYSWHHLNILQDPLFTKLLYRFIQIIELNFGKMEGILSNNYHYWSLPNTFISVSEIDAGVKIEARIK